MKKYRICDKNGVPRGEFHTLGLAYYALVQYPGGYVQKRVPGGWQEYV